MNNITLKLLLLFSSSGLLFLSNPTHADYHPEDAVISAISAMKSGRPQDAQKALEPLLQSEPSFRLARLLYADSLNAQHGGPISFQSTALDPLQLDGLLAEAKQRSKYFEIASDIQNKVPFGLIKPESKHPYLLFADMGLSRVFLFKQDQNGQLNLVKNYYASGGKLGNRKEVRGDKRTPLGVYFITQRLPGEQLEDRYGHVAFPIDYPNKWDRLNKRTGDGIWLHGVTSATYSRPPLDSDGCIALPNDDLRELENYLSIGMPVVIGENVKWLDRAEHQTLQNTLSDALDQWRAAWESQDNQRYLSFYAPNFKTEKYNYRTWAAYKSRVNSAKSFINVQVSDPVIYGYPDKDNMVQIDFTQDYRSNNINGKVRKRQYWQLQEDGQWKIIYEGNLKRL